MLDFVLHVVYAAFNAQYLRMVSTAANYLNEPLTRIDIVPRLHQVMSELSLIAQHCASTDCTVP